MSKSRSSTYTTWDPLGTARPPDGRVASATTMTMAHASTTTSTPTIVGATAAKASAMDSSAWGESMVRVWGIVVSSTERARATRRQAQRRRSARSACVGYATDGYLLEYGPRPRTVHRDARRVRTDRGARGAAARALRRARTK